MRRIKLEYTITYLGYGDAGYTVMLHVEPADLVIQLQDICNAGGTIHQIEDVEVEIV